MPINIELLRQVVEWVEAESAKPYDSQEWRQKWWFERVTDDPEALSERLREPSWCGTKVCVAGKVAILAGYQPVFATPYTTHTELVQPEDGGQPVFTTEVAAEELGITGGQAEFLFHSLNDAADIRRYAEQIADQPL